MALAFDRNFKIDAVYPGFWNKGRAVRTLWKYDTNHHKIEFLSLGDDNDPDYRITWQYDAVGRVLKEIHYDMYNKAIAAVIEFDTSGNVIKETHFDFWAKKKYRYTFSIRYW